MRKRRDEERKEAKRQEDKDEELLQKVRRLDFGHLINTVALTSSEKGLMVGIQIHCIVREKKFLTCTVNFASTLRFKPQLEKKGDTNLFCFRPVNYL
jgi:hypothetical protein